jgi:hypothetical protein
LRRDFYVEKYMKPKSRLEGYEPGHGHDLVTEIEKNEGGKITEVQEEREEETVNKKDRIKEKKFLQPKSNRYKDTDPKRRGEITINDEKFVAEHALEGYKSPEDEIVERIDVGIKEGDEGMKEMAENIKKEKSKARPTVWRAEEDKVGNKDKRNILSRIRRKFGR